ncbi:MAG: recombinase family protein [Eggerthellaceae bacterium]|nr:recombinase family protein [Eggerthellaceae bacterium]
MYGYARVSSKDQNLDRQLDALAGFGVKAGHLFADKASGRDFERPEWRRLMGLLGEGDVLAVKINIAAQALHDGEVQGAGALAGAVADALRGLVEGGRGASVS